MISVAGAPEAAVDTDDDNADEEGDDAGAPAPGAWTSA